MTIKELKEMWKMRDPVDGYTIAIIIIIIGYLIYIALPKISG